MNVAVTVDVGACRCAGSPHPNDWIELEPRLTAAMGVAASWALRGAESEGQLRGDLAEAWLRLGIRRWSFVDETGKPVPVTGDAIDRLIPWGQGGMEAASRTMELYLEEFTAPLSRAARLSTPTPQPASQPGPTAGSISPTPTTGDDIPEQSPPSSPSAKDG